MARLPTVAIIGRPNTGKSTLFNRLIGRRLAIESEVPGTTRDHVAQRVETDEVDYLLIDTGGMGGGTEEKDIEDDVHLQSLLALEHADLIVLTVNARSPLTGSDEEIVMLLRKKRKRHVPVILVLTKCDNPDLAEEATMEFSGLGIADEILPVSAAHGLGLLELREMIVKHLRKLKFSKTKNQKPKTNASPRAAIVGKPNVGKSSLINAFMSEPERKKSPRLVSPIAGTTRDSTDAFIHHEGHEYIFVDTAGLRRQAKVEHGLESLSMMRSIKAIEDSDIVILVLEATEPVSRQDKRIASIAIEAGKGLIVLINKIDLLKGEKRREKTEEVRQAFPFCRYAPILPCSATERTNLLKVFPLIDMVQRSRTRRIPDRELHRWYRDSVANQPVGALAAGKHLTQAEQLPPTFVLFVRNPKQVQLSQLRFLENRLRETFGFDGTPVRWITKGPRDR